MNIEERGGAEVGIGALREKWEGAQMREETDEKRKEECRSGYEDKDEEAEDEEQVEEDFNAIICIKSRISCSNHPQKRLTVSRDYPYNVMSALRGCRAANSDSCNNL